jgi:hypothetical protein
MRSDEAHKVRGLPLCQVLWCSVPITRLAFAQEAVCVHLQSVGRHGFGKDTGVAS